MFHPFLSFARTFGIYYVFLGGYILTYRLSPMHPLAGYPGPLLAKVSKIWIVFHGRDGNQHRVIQDLHRTYGDVVRIGPNELSFANAFAIMPLMGTTGAAKGPNWQGRTLFAPIPSLVSLRDNAIHARRRKPWSRAMSTSALKEYQIVIAQRSAQFVETLLDQKGQVDLSERISFYTWDFMSDMAFGGGSEMMRDGDVDGYWKLLEDGLSLAFLLDHLPWIGYYIRNIPGVGEDLKRMRAMGIERATVRANAGSHSKDLFYYLSNEDGADKVSPPRPTIISDGILAIIAGSDTTSSILSIAFYHLLLLPEVYEKLQSEIDTYYPEGEDTFDTKHHSKMSYLDAVLNETLRMYPVIPSGSQRTFTEGEGGRMIGPYFVPNHTQVRVPNYTLHHDPRYFHPNPDTFWPERWLIAEGLIRKPEVPFIHDMNAFIPFSFGPANCVGKNLAMLEMKMLLCHSIQKLRFRFADGFDPTGWENGLKDYFTLRRAKLPVVVESRA
ncbi:cytochrome P450 [Abortiporus biennis]|nr:cytochrome P450 [Abortiporus biennis]